MPGGTLTGAFVAVDGPNGVGKSSVVRRAAELLRGKNLRVAVTKEPTQSPLGRLAKQLDGGMRSEVAYACLIAADRWEHSEEIADSIKTCDVLITDRYLASSLVLNVARGVREAFITSLHVGLRRPDLTVILVADPEELNRRMGRRNLGTTRGEALTTRRDEAQRYAALEPILRAVGCETRMLDTTHLTEEQVATTLASIIQESIA
jgi:dTMP kinase